ncbi:MAG: DNA adenine methylase [Nanoarchaeota archaeon]|nr:DNA adenine methylase [Nanoarchaeota archaeon]
MRFIGSKTNLLEDIRAIIKDNCPNAISFCDIFSGTTSVARFFKKDFLIISNDLLHFSFVLQKATIENNKKPSFINLKKINIDDPINFLNEFEPKIDDLKSEPFIFNNYTPNHNHDRSYFSKENALKIDFIRQKIEEWKNDKLIEENEYYYLIACLIEAVPFVSNIAGTFGAYLKHWDKRAFKKIELKNFEIINNGKQNKSFNKDSNILITEIKGDILYIDPPYNSRQYLPNYHVLETISKYDNPEIYGKTGLRPYNEVKSKYCVKGKVLDEFSKLIKTANFKYIIVSYSSEGLMSEEEIKNVLTENGIKSTYMLKKIPYRRYKHTKGEVKHSLNEFLFFITKR